MTAKTIDPQAQSAGEVAGRAFLLCKRGLYYRPDNCGYTGIKAYAGRYLESEAMPDAGVTAIHEDDAPMFSKACFDDLRVKFLLEQIAALEAERDALREALSSFALSIRDDVPDGKLINTVSFTAGTYRRAKAALAVREILNGEQSV